MQEGTNSLRKLRRDWWKTKLCTACVSPLGRFLSRGGTCPQCGLRVCKNCRSESPSGTWVCVLCSGGMPSDDLTKTTKSLERDSRSIRRSWTISNPQRAQTNSPILKSYTVLCPDDGVTTDGSGGCGSSNDSIDGRNAGCSVSTSHLSTFKDVTMGDRGHNGQHLRLGNSDLGICPSGAYKTAGKSNYYYKTHHHHQESGVSQRGNRDGSNGIDNEDDEESVNNGMSSARQFHSLPRMNSNSTGGLSLFAPSSSSSTSSAVARVLGLANKVNKRSFNSHHEKESIKRHRSFQSTLHPYNPAPTFQVNPPPSPATSVNFIEETFWDYYDYELENSSSDPGSTPRNLRKSATAAAISDLAADKRPLDSNTNSRNITNNSIQTKKSSQVHPESKSSAIAAFKTDSNRSSCERSLGETMDYDCSLRLNQFSSLSDTDINEPSKYEEKGKQNVYPPSSSSTAYQRQRQDVDRSPRPYATISSTNNPYLPASEYVYRRRHDEMLNEAPPKPERKSRSSKRSVSMSAYDGRRLFSPLKTYCVLMKENIEPENRAEINNSYSSYNNAPSSSHPEAGRTNNEHSMPPSTSTMPHRSMTQNSSPISLSLTTCSSPLKFNSLPRERYIRIEREDGDGSTNVEKYSSLKYPSRKSEVLLGKSGTTTDYYQNPISPAAAAVDVSNNSSSKGKNVTRVPIVKDDNHHLESVSNHHRQNRFTLFNGSPPKSKIERSQSYKEISSSRPYPYYHHYHPQNAQLSQSFGGMLGATNSIPRNHHNRHLKPNSDKPSTTADLNLMPAAGTKTTLPANFPPSKGKAAPSSLSVWEEENRQYRGDVDIRKSSGVGGGGPGNFFHSEFDDGSDVVIENFIKTHSSSAGNSNSNSNTLPRRKYPPSTTHISLAPHHQHSRRGSEDDYLYHHDIESSGAPNNKSDFKETNFQRDHSSSSDNYLRQCSTFPRGASSHAKLQPNKDSAAPIDSRQVQTEQMPKLTKNYSNNNSNTNTNRTRNNASNFLKGYPCHDELDVFFHPTVASTPSSKEFENVPKQQQHDNRSEERILPIKISSLTAGSGFSATLPHPYIRRKAQGVMTNGAEKSPHAGGIDNDKRETMPGSTGNKNNKNSGPSISQVEMDIERDIFYQKTRSLDRVKPSSKSKLKSMLSFGRSTANAPGADTDGISSTTTNSAKEIDYSDSQPYNNQNKSRLHEKLFSIDQVDRNYANARSNEAVGNLNSKSISSVTSDLHEPQQVHHSGNRQFGGSTAAPIPSPRLKRKAKLQQPQQQTTLCSPKINGDEMSSSTSSSAKHIGPGTNYGSKKLLFPSSSPSVSAHLLNESDSHDNSHGAAAHSKGETKTNATNSKSSTNPISFRSSSNKEQSDGSFAQPKDSSMRADHPNYPSHHSNPLIDVAANANGVDGTIKSENSTGGGNHISQPSSGPVTLHFANSNNPGANFMISSSPSANIMLSNNSALSSTGSSNAPVEYEMGEEEQTQFATSSPSDSNKTKVPLVSLDHQSANVSSQIHHQQIKSALSNSSSNFTESGKVTNSGNGGGVSGGGKAVRFEPHVIAMEIESEQRKLLQQQQLNQQHPHSGTAMNGNSSGINSQPGVVGDDGSVSGAAMKSNSGNLMHRHGPHHGNKASRHNHPTQPQHYVHASSYLPVLYHSYHQQQHKYIRKGAGGSSLAGGSKSGKKSKKYKGFVARAIAKVKSKAALKKDSVSGTTNSAPTVYYPVGKQPPGVPVSPPNSSVITYISPQPQTQHQQPPAQQSLEENAGKELTNKSGNVPSITVSLTSIEAPSHHQSVSTTLNSGEKVTKRLLTPASGKHSKKVVPQNSKFLKGAPHLPRGGSSRRMDGYNTEAFGVEKFLSLDDHQQLHHSLPKQGDDGGLPIPDSFYMQSDRITPSSTSSSSSSFTSNLQESYELFHNHTLLAQDANEMALTEDQKGERDNVNSDEDDEERYDSLNEDEDSDNANYEEDGPSAVFKSFDESEEEDEEPDFVFYPTPRGSGGTAASGLARQQQQPDSNRNKAITSATTTTSSSSSTDAAFNAPFAHNNETTTKGSKGKSAATAAVEQKMIGIPTFRSPNSRKLIKSQIHQPHQYGKTQASFPNVAPTVTPSQMQIPSSSLDRNVNQAKSSSASKPFSSSVLSQPHPLAEQSNSENAAIVCQGDAGGIMKGASFGSLKDSLTSSTNNRYQHQATVSSAKGLMSQPQLSGNAQPRYGDQVDDNSLQSQPFVPFHDKDNNSKGMPYNERRRDEQSEHERNVDHDTRVAEATLQKENLDDDNDNGLVDVNEKKAANGGVAGGAAYMANNAADSGTRQEEKEYPRDAKGFSKISSTGSSSGRSTGATVRNNAEGRLSDLTTPATTPEHSQHSPEEGEVHEKGLRYGASAKYLCSDSPNAYHGLLSEQNEEDSLLQARTSSPCSWASKTKSSSNGAPNNTDRETHNHNTVTKTSSNNNSSNNNNNNNENQKDVERLQRLELVKRQQQNILTHINNSGQQKGNLKSVSSSCASQGSDSFNFHLVEGADQPNSLETQCANDQSFLSESEVGSSHGGKSPSPSPRFKPKKFVEITKNSGVGGGGRGRASPSKLPQKLAGESKIPSILRKSGNVAGEVAEQSAIASSSHLLNIQPKSRSSPAFLGNKGNLKESSAENVVKGTIGREEQGEEKDTLAFCPDSGRAGMSILPPPPNHPHTKTTSAPAPNNESVGKFKSRVLLNSDDLEEEEELSRAIADVTNGTTSPQKSQTGKKNITTVEISGDVGIVSSNLLHNVGQGRGGATGSPTASEATSISNRQRSVVSSDHLQSSGLSLIQKPALLDHSSSEEEEEDSCGAGETPIEPDIKPKKIGRSIRRDPFSLEEEVGSSVSANESSGGDTEKTSDDNSSDWQSESTNTVIFRGNPSTSNVSGIAAEDSFYASGYLDPEIQINNITVGDHHEDDDEVGGSGGAAPIEFADVSAAGAGKVNVGYKATKVNKVSSDLIIGIKKSSSDNTSSGRTSSSSTEEVTKIGSKRKFDKGNDVSSSSSSSAVDSSEELGKSNETLTDIPAVSGHNHDQVAPQFGDELVEEQDSNLEVEMVMHPDKKEIDGGSNRLYVPNSANQRRESPEGQEQEVPDRTCSEDSDDKVITVKVSSGESERGSLGSNAKEKKMEGRGGEDAGAGGGDHRNGQKAKKATKSSSRGAISKEKILQNVLSQIPNRSSPDGADKSDRDATPEPEVQSPSPGAVDNFDVTSDEDSWVEEILFEDEDDHSFEETAKKLPPPLDLTLHTIVEESCEESEAENSGNFYQQSTSGLGGSQKNTSLSQSESNANELEKYFNFGIYNDTNSGSKNSLPNEESEFSDTFSESSFSLQEDEFDGRAQQGHMDPAELASTRLEKYFYNLGGPQSVMNTLSSAMMNQNADSDSVGSESDSDNSVLEKRKKVLKHHRRSADFEEEFGDKVSDEEDSFGFGQDGFDTIKKTARKTKKSGSDGSIDNGGISTAMNHGSTGTLTDKGENEANVSSFTNKHQSGPENTDGESPAKKTSTGSTSQEKPTIKVNRSNSFTWSSDEEVNIMMSKLRQLIKNLIKSKTEGGHSAGEAHSSSGSQTADNSNKDKQLVYLENELIRLMKTDNLKNIVEYLSSEESDVDDVYKFIKVVNSAGSTPVDLDDLGDLGDLDIDDPNLLENLQSTMQLQSDGTNVSPKSSPALLAKVMHHIGNRLNMWMKDEGNVEDDNNDDNVTLKCAPSVSSDLNEDRFSWKGSFESALAAKRQSVGSTDSISSSDYGQDKSMLRSSSLHHLTSTSQTIEENKEEEESNSSLPRMTNLCNSLPRLNQPNSSAISRAHSLVMTGKNEQPQPGTETYPVSISGPVKSARYRPPGFQPSMKAKRIDTEEKASPAILSQSTPVLTQDPTILKNRSDSMGSIVHDIKPVISVKGQVEFGLQYNYKLACLEVKVVGCRDLAAADSKRNRSDPYVKAYLLPDKSKAGKRKTKTKKNTLNPVFDEVLKFPLTLSDLQKRTLWLSVWHSDMFGKNEFLGEILVALKDRVFDDPNPSWWDLEEMSGQMEDMPKGDVVIALKWTPKTENTGNLSVLVKEAKNLVPVKNGSPSTFVKCALLSDKTRKQKTSICRRNFNPIWNQTLLFEDVDDEGVEITIWNHDLLASHDLIGTVRLEYDNPLWESMISRPSFWVESGLKLS